MRSDRVSDDPKYNRWKWHAYVQRQYGLSLCARVTAFWIADHYNLAHGYAWPSTARLARLVQCTVRSVRKAIKELMSASLLKVDYGRGRKTSRYVPCLPPGCSFERMNDSSKHDR
jgi:hypothetical protein